jgi:hypothetical protein
MKSYLHTYKLTHPDGKYRVEVYDGDYMSPKEAMEKMRISIRGLKAYKYSGASSDSEKYNQWQQKKSAGYSNEKAWDEVFGSEKYKKGGDVESEEEIEDAIRFLHYWNAGEKISDEKLNFIRGVVNKYGDSNLKKKYGDFGKKFITKKEEISELHLELQNMISENKYAQGGNTNTYNYTIGGL